MRAQEYWDLFLQTGDPVIYLLFNSARKMESNYVSDNPGIGLTGHGIQ